MVIKVNININKVKIVVMVPRSNADSLREIICNTGAGVIGNYTDCSVSTKVIGTFKPNSKANPTIGRKEKLVKVKEIKLEVICIVEKQISLIKFATLKYIRLNPDCFGHLEITTIN